MRFSTTIAAIAATTVPFAHALSKGFNVAAQNPDGSCKTTAQWTTAFNKLKALPQHFNTVRLYASSDCNTLANAVPAAINTGTKILVGLWTEDDAHFQAEKDALEAAINQHGSDWILAVSVGSEDLYRGDTSADKLANQIYDVKGMIHQWNDKQVGHVDTWTAWVDGANTAVVAACDFLGMDGYPYFQSAAIKDAASVFWQSVTDTTNAAQGKPVWITETGKSSILFLKFLYLPYNTNMTCRLASLWSEVRCSRPLPYQCQEVLEPNCMQSLLSIQHLLVCVPGLHPETLFRRFRPERQVHVRPCSLLDNERKYKRSGRMFWDLLNAAWISIEGLSSHWIR